MVEKNEPVGKGELAKEDDAVAAVVEEEGFAEATGEDAPISSSEDEYSMESFVSAIFVMQNDLVD